MTIGVCGYGFSGSGAVTDLLKEFSDTQVLDAVEFKLTYMQDGLEDLYYHLVTHPVRFYSSDVAIRRFKRLVAYLDKTYGPLTQGKFMLITNEFIQEITQVTWKGSSSFHRIDSSKSARFFKYQFAEKIRKVAYKYAKLWWSFPDTEMYLSISPEGYMSAAQNLINELIACLVDSNKTVVINQAFPADRPEFSFPYFNDPKAICVSRDPRDMYLLAKFVAKHRARFIPTDSVDAFIVYYNTIMSNITQDELDKKNILRINFEDLIYRYQETIGTIKEFTGISNHTAPLRYFNPDISIRNTNLREKFPQFQSDIKKIEQALGSWLYRFDEYDMQNPASHGTVF